MEALDRVRCSQVMHADYFSGWDKQELQQLLNLCVNAGDDSLPNFFCEDFVTFRTPTKTGMNHFINVIYSV